MYVSNDCTSRVSAALSARRIDRDQIVRNVRLAGVGAQLLYDVFGLVVIVLAKVMMLGNLPRTYHTSGIKR
jgi:hypothetical protein